MNQRSSSSDSSEGARRYTPKQGQYLAFIYYYTKLNGLPPAERDMERYFGTSPSAVHQIVVTLEKRRLIERVHGQGRSIRLLLTRQEIPDLEYSTESRTQPDEP